MMSMANSANAPGTMLPAEASLDRRGGAPPYIVISPGAGGSADHDLGVGGGLVRPAGFLGPESGNKPNLRLDGDL
jgi:hypothetical protein